MPIQILFVWCGNEHAVRAAQEPVAEREAAARRVRLQRLRVTMGSGMPHEGRTRIVRRGEMQPDAASFGGDLDARRQERFDRCDNREPRESVEYVTVPLGR